MNAHAGSLLATLTTGLENYQQAVGQLPGVQTPVHRDVFLYQLIDSIRRVAFAKVIATRSISPKRADGLSDLFDPLRAAIWRATRKEHDEACWLTFLFVHFGRHPVSGYRYTREVYSALGQRAPWTFKEVTKEPDILRAWLDANKDHLSRGSNRGFGNHRKYLSLSGAGHAGTGDAFVSYVEWVNAHGDHQQLFNEGLNASGGNPEGAFEWLYKSMIAVSSFGRTGRFDYLTMIHKLNLATLRPGRPYFDSTTSGPNKGAQAMFGGMYSIKELESLTVGLGNYLGVGMQEMEDALCNWGKDPGTYHYFRG